MNKKLKAANFFCLLLSSPLLAQTNFESSVVRFNSTKNVDDLIAASASTSGELFGEEGQGNNTNFIVSHTTLRSKSLATPKTVANTTYERRGSIGINQSIERLTTIGATYGYTATSNLSQWYAFRIGQWWNKATISSDLELMKTNGASTSRDYIDTDGMRVRTSSHVNSDRLSLALTWLATPQAMLLASVAATKSADRPNSISESLEGRYFVPESKTAFHLKLGNYQDNGNTGKRTDYGRVSAKTWEGQIHQHLTEQIIASAIMRDHFEQEIPRSAETITIHRHDRGFQGRVRYRFVTGPVTETVPEIYIFSGQYNAYDEKMTVRHIGLGGQYVL